MLPQFDPMMPTTYNDSYALVVYALPMAKTVIPAPQMGLSTVRLVDGIFHGQALATLGRPQII